MKEKPSKEQIEKFLKHVKSLALFFAIKNREEEPDPDLVRVMQWLENEMKP